MDNWMDKYLGDLSRPPQKQKKPTVISDLIKGLDAGMPFGVTSFEQLDAAEASLARAQGMDVLTAQLKSIVDGILMSPDIVDKPAAIESAAREFARRVRNPADALKSAGSVTEIKSLVTQLLPFPVKPQSGPTFAGYILEGFEELNSNL